jgi:DNA-binding LacI/PurR family transcriptional regulator
MRSPLPTNECTIFDVARKAGVSIATVSLSLRGDKRVAEATRQAVIKAAAELKYHPNLSAQSLASKKTNLIAVCGWFFPDSLEHNSHASMQMLMGIHGRIKNTRYAVYMVDWSSQPDEHRRLLSDFSSRRFICGSIWMSPTLDAIDLKLIQGSSLPVALAEALSPKTDCAGPDDARGAYLGAQHLLSKKKPLHLIVGLPGQIQKNRLLGVRRAAMETGVSWNAIKRWTAPSYSFKDGYEVAGRFAKGAKKGGAAIFSLAGDRSALGFMDGLAAAGLRVPEDVLVMGYDGESAGNYSRPKLSTLLNPHYEIGYKAAEALIHRIENFDSPLQHLLLQPKLLLRESA